jgi:hypothetical protein
MKYKLWRDSVIRLLKRFEIIKENKEVSYDIYMPYFIDGYSPMQAIKEDLGIDISKQFYN